MYSSILIISVRNRVRIASHPCLLYKATKLDFCIHVILPLGSCLEEVSVPLVCRITRSNGTVLRERSKLNARSSTVYREIFDPALFSPLFPSSVSKCFISFFLTKNTNVQGWAKYFAYVLKSVEKTHEAYMTLITVIATQCLTVPAKMSRCLL